MKIPITKVNFDQEEKNALIKSLDSGWIVQGPYVAEFEKMFSRYTSVSYARALSNCTTALHLGLISMGIGQGSKVVVPAFTYVASANAVEHAGAEVVFCDIDLTTFNLDVNKLQYLLENEPGIKAIMPVHLFGLCANMHVIMDLANQYQVKIIEDAACAFDSWIDDKHAGTFGDCGCFSFHPRKAITTGEGGMLITNHDYIASHVSQLRDHGASKSDLQRHKGKGGSLLPDFNMLGYNYRMTDIQGALGVCQMSKASQIMHGRRKIAQQYNEFLKSNPYLVTPFVPTSYIHSYQSYVCLFMGNGEIDLPNLTIEKIDRLNLQRNYFMEKLELKGIATRQGTHAVHTLGYYQRRYKLAYVDYLMAYAADRLSIALPLYSNMSLEEFNYITNNITEALAECVEFAV